MTLAPGSLSDLGPKISRGACSAVCTGSNGRYAPFIRRGMNPVDH
jgi:hypothetical protein